MKAVPKFLIVRFLPGSGGKFLSSILQLLDGVCCWDPELDFYKQCADTQNIVGWFQTKFTQNWKEYLKIEPEVPYHLDFISNRFSRGDDITLSDLLDRNRSTGDDLFQSQFYGDGQIPLILNKSRIPCAYQNNSQIVNMLIDSPHARSWVARARARKLFYEIEPGKFVLKQDHPDYCSEKRKILASKFDNPKLIQTSKFRFIKQFVVNYPGIGEFSDIKSMLKDPSNRTCDQHIFPVSSFCDTRNLNQTLVKLARVLGKEPWSDSLLDPLLDFYVSINK